MARAYGNVPGGSGGHDAEGQAVAESDSSLIARAVEGDRDALTQLLHKHGPQLRQHLHISPTWRAFLDIEDVLQVTYLEAFLRIRQLISREPAAFARWLRMIAENSLRNAIKELGRDKRANPRRRLRSPTLDESTALLLERVARTSMTASRIVRNKESQEALLQAVARLPRTYRAVVELCDLEGKSPAEVARTLGRSAGAVHMLRARAHQRLGEILASK
jgi:RNA polymerase sigma factor (sigma-70 family)